MMYMGFDVDPESGSISDPGGRKVCRRDRNGYIWIRRNGQYVDLAHRIIWRAVNGEIPPGLQINHKNGVKGDNRIANLELATRSQNTSHAYRMGLRSATGEANGRAILKVSDVEEIRRLADSVPHSAIAKRFGVATATVTGIVIGRAWKSVRRVEV